MNYIFMGFLLTSVIGTVLSVVLTLLKPITRKVFSSGWHYYMWLVVLLVMTLPIRFTIPESNVTKTSFSETITHTDNQNENIETLGFSEIQPQHITSKEVVEPKESSVIQTLKSRFDNKFTQIAYIWLVVAIILFVLKVSRYMIFLRKIYKHSEAISCPEVKEYTKRQIKTRESNTIGSPLVVGIFRPTLLLPKADITKQQLHNILKHECTHIKRHDILYKWFVCMVKCIHWFNPAIYFINKQINIDCEISCDLSVVKQMDEQEEKVYVETILSLLSHNNTKSVPMTTGMTGNKKILKRRFIMIKEKIKISKRITVISGILAILILITTVFASGVLNHALFKPFNNSIIKLNTDKVTSNEFNLLFVGLDNNNRADTIMILTVQENGIKGLSIPRNTIFFGQKISDFLATENGDQAVIDAIRQKLSVPVHYYAKMDLSAIKQIIDNVDGIDFEVPMDMIYDDPHQNLHINLKKGNHNLNGEEVCQLLQFRQGYTEGDLSRIQLHQQFIKEFIKQKFNKENIDKAPELFKIISNNIVTTYPISNLEQDMKTISAINSNNIVFETIPGKNAIHNGIAVYEIDLNDNIELADKSNESKTFVWPTESTKVTRGLETRVHPITGEVKHHNGVDISADENSPVFSAISGEVTKTGFDTEFGNYVIIQNSSGIKTYYGHLSSVEVKNGDITEPKTVIGKVGKTGTATGACLHFEIQINGEYMNPEQLISN